MRSRWMILSVAIVGCMATAGAIRASAKTTLSVVLADDQPEPAAVTPVETCEQGAFRKLKSLVGEWEGTAGPEGGEAMPATVTYRLTAGGSVLVETLFPGSEHEMMTMYHMDGTDLVLTHYCAVGNQPRLKATAIALAPGEGQLPTVGFECIGAVGNAASENDTHMHAGEFTFVDADHLQTAWTGHANGQIEGRLVFDLKRKAAIGEAQSPAAPGR